MGPVVLVAWTGLRERWPTVLATTVALGLSGAIALAATAGSLRGRDALDEFIEFSRIGTVEVFVDPALPPEEQVATLERVVAASGEPTFASITFAVVGLPGPEGLRDEGADLLMAEAMIDGPLLEDVRRPIVVDGALPLGPGEAAINEVLRDRRRLAVGDTLEVAVFAGEDLELVANGEVPEPTSVQEVAVGAVVRQPLDLARSPQAQPGTVYEAEEARLVLEPGFLDAVGPDVANYGRGAFGQPSAAAIPAVTEAMEAEGGGAVLVNPSGPEDRDRLGPVADAIALETNALLAVAGVVLAFALFVVGGAAARATASSDDEALTTVGFTTRQLTSVRLTRGAAVAVVAWLAAVVASMPASALFPVGLAADAELDPGVHLDLPVLLGGGLALLALLLGRFALAARTARRRSRPVRRTVVLPLAPSGIGARRTLDGVRRPGSTAPRVALAGAVLGIGAVAAAATYTASIDHLLGDPARQGWTWDVAVGNFFLDTTAAEAADRLRADPDVAEIVGFNWTTLEVDGRNLPIGEIDDATTNLLPVVLEGRAPVADDEIAFGRGTLDELGKEVGDTVEVVATGEPVSAEIVGAVVAPAVLSPTMDLDSGGIATFGFTGRVFADQAGVTSITTYLVALGDDADRPAAIDRLEEAFPGTVLRPMQPLDVAALERVRDVPRLLATVLGVLALVSVAAALVDTSRRRRRDLAVLRALGLARGQLHRLHAGEATTFLALAAGIGLPAGIVVGRAAWTLAADGLGSELGPTVPALVLVAATLALLAAVNLYAQGLALLMARRRPGEDLRTE